MTPELQPIAMEDVLATSFRDFHAKGFDYICLKRSEAETVKLYFFDGDASRLSEVVNPHDHRYDFVTHCLAGAVENRWFKMSGNGQPFQMFEYRTPLNGGNGFRWSGEVRLKETRRLLRRAGKTYGMGFDELHTISIRENETVLILRQYRDLVPVEAATRAFTRDREPPSLDGLYRRFDADTIRNRLARLKERAPSFNIPEVV